MISARVWYVHIVCGDEGGWQAVGRSPTHVLPGASHWLQAAGGGRSAPPSIVAGGQSSRVAARAPRASSFRGGWVERKEQFVRTCPRTGLHTWEQP